MAKDYLLTFLSTGPGGEQYANTICAHDSESGGVRSAADTVDNFDAWLKTKYKNILPTHTRLDVLRCFRIPEVYGDDSEVASKLIGENGTVTVSSLTLPREMCVTLSLRSSHTSRRTMGRISLPSPGSNGFLTTGGLWDVGTGWWAAIGTFGAALLAGHDIGVAGVGGHLSTRIYSRQQHKEGSGDKTTDVNSYFRQPRPRWLRRRTSVP